MQDPNEMELLIREFVRRYGGKLVWVVPVVVVIALLTSVFYSVQADSEGVVLRLGSYERTSEPGLHGKLPWPLEKVYEVPVQRVQSLEFGFSTVQPGRVTRYAATTQEQESVALMLTGDLNLAHVEWIVQYRINNARDYLFKIGGHPEAVEAINDTIRSVSEAVMRKLIGDVSVDEVITIGRDKIAMDAKLATQEMLDSFETGVEIVTVKLQSATPPEAVKDAFDEVNRARQNKERVINEAEGEKNRMIPAARGKRDQAILEAEGYRDKQVKTAKGQVNAFLAQLTEYEKAPEVTRTRLYLETMEEIMAGVDDKIVIDASVRGLLPFLDLSSAPQPTVPGKGGAK